MHLNNRCAVTVDDPSEWAKKIAAAGCVMKTALELIDTKSHKSLAFYTFAWHKKPTKAMKHHETLRGCTFTCMSAPGWNDEIPIGRFTGAVFWHGLGYILSFKQGMAHKILWMTKLSGFLGQEFHPGSENRESTQFLLIRHLRSLKISWISSIQRPTSPCLDILVTSFGFLSIVQTPVLLGASRTKVGENAWIAWVLETRSSC